MEELASSVSFIAKVLIYNINYNQCKFEIMTHAIDTSVIHFYCYFHLFAANNGVRDCI